MNPYRWASLGEPYVPPPRTPTPRSFGLLVGGVFAAIALYSLWRSHVVRAEVTAALAAYLLVAALVWPASLSPIARGWSYIGHGLGWFNSRALPALMLVRMVRPIRLIPRLFGNHATERDPAT